MNRYSQLSQEQMLDICKILDPDIEWSLNQILDNNGKGTDDCYEFIGTDGSCIQINIHQNEDDELRFYAKGNFDDDIYPLITDTSTRSIEMEKITEYLDNLSATSTNKQDKKTTNENKTSNVTDKQIKNKYVEIVGIDKFTKIEEFKLKSSIELYKKTLEEYADSQAGVSNFNSKLENISAKLNRSNFYLYFDLIYRKKVGQDIFIVKIRLSQVNLSGNDFKLNALKDGQIFFLFDDDQTITLNKALKYTPGTSEEIYFETDISILTKIINSKTVDYRLQGSRGIISESKLSKNDIMLFVGFYNALFDPTFRRKEINALLSKKKAPVKKKTPLKKKAPVKNKVLEKKSSEWYNTGWLWFWLIIFWPLFIVGLILRASKK